MHVRRLWEGVFREWEFENTHEDSCRLRVNFRRVTRSAKEGEEKPKTNQKVVLAR